MLLVGSGQSILQSMNHIYRVRGTLLVGICMSKHHEEPIIGFCTADRSTDTLLNHMFGTTRVDNEQVMCWLCLCS